MLNHITRTRLTDALAEMKGTHIVTLSVRSRPETIRGCPFRELTKIAAINCIIGEWDYAVSVNRQRCRDGTTPDFQAQCRAWGERLPRGALAEYQGCFYLPIKQQAESATLYFDGTTPVSADQVAPWLRKRKPGRQDVDRPVLHKDVRLDHIMGLCWGGTVYLVVDTLPTLPKGNIPQGVTP